MKSFLELSFPELSDEISGAENIEGVMNIIIRKCNVNDISMIETIVNRYKINEAKSLISEYEEEVKKVCGSLKDMLSQSQSASFSTCDTIEFMLSHLLEEELDKRISIKSIHDGNEGRVLRNTSTKQPISSGMYWNLLS